MHIGVINVDASGWNKRFRSQTVNPIMEKSLDKIFNYPIFTTHEMYTKMLFYTSDDIYIYVVGWSWPKHRHVALLLYSANKIVTRQVFTALSPIRKRRRYEDICIDTTSILRDKNYGRYQIDQAVISVRVSPRPPQ